MLIKEKTLFLPLFLFCNDNKQSEDVVNPENSKVKMFLDLLPGFLNVLFCNSRPILTGELDDDHVTNEESKMYEDSEEIDALLYSNNEGN